MHRINLPISDPRTVRHHRRPLFNGLFTRQPPTAVIASIPFAPLLPRSTKVPPQAPATPFVLPDPAVNGLVAHHRCSLKLPPPHNLSGTKPLANQRRNGLKFRRPIKPVPPRSSLAATRFLHRMAGAIAAIMGGAIPLHLPIQRATMPSKMFRHLCHSQTLPAQRGNLITFLRAQSLIFHPANLSHCQLESKRPNKSPEPTAVGAVRSAVAVHVASRRWLSFFR